SGPSGLYLQRSGVDKREGGDMINERFQFAKLAVSALALGLTLYSSAGRAQGPGWTTSCCQPQSGYSSGYSSISPTHPGRNEMQANLLTAYAAGTQVVLWFSDSTCTVGEMILGGTPF